MQLTRRDNVKQKVGNDLNGFLDRRHKHKCKYIALPNRVKLHVIAVRGKVQLYKWRKVSLSWDFNRK